MKREQATIQISSSKKNSMKIRKYLEQKLNWEKEMHVHYTLQTYQIPKKVH